MPEDAQAEFYRLLRKKQKYELLNLDRRFGRGDCDVFNLTSAETVRNEHAEAGCKTFSVEVNTTVWDPQRTGAFELCHLHYKPDANYNAWNHEDLKLVVEALLPNGTQPYLGRSYHAMRCTSSK